MTWGHASASTQIRTQCLPTVMGDGPPGQILGYSRALSSRHRGTRREPGAGLFAYPFGLTASMLAASILWHRLCPGTSPGPDEKRPISSKWHDVAEPEQRGFFRVVSILLLILLACALQPVTLAAEATPRGGGPMPMVFEPNEGQADAAVKFLARGRGYGLFLTPTETVLVVAPAGAGRGREPQGDAPAAEPVVVRMRLVGADPAATIAGVDPLPGRSHYLLGESARWRRSVPSFARVQYTGVYPGVSLVFYGTERQLEYDFVVAPGADPAAVVLAFDGADGVRLDGDGDLVLATGAGEIRLHRPVIYQEAGGERRPVEGGYVLDGQRVRFRVAAWDASRPLVIDPVLGYSTFLGGSSNDQGFGIAVDSGGNAYVTGSTISSNFPLSPVPLRATRAGATDAFVTKLSPTGTLVICVTG